VRIILFNKSLILSLTKDAAENKVSKNQADILFAFLLALLVLVFFWTFFGLKDRLESLSVPQFIAFVGPIVFSLVGAAVLSSLPAKMVQ